MIKRSSLELDPADGLGKAPRVEERTGIRLGDLSVFAIFRQLSV